MPNAICTEKDINNTSCINENIINVEALIQCAVIFFSFLINARITNQRAVIKSAIKPVKRVKQVTRANYLELTLKNMETH